MLQIKIKNTQIRPEFILCSHAEITEVKSIKYRNRIAIEVKDGYKFYGRPSDPNKKIVLNYLNMHVMSGSIYGLLGASGCGKTTLLSCIVGQKKLHEGCITVLGINVGKNASFIGPRIGYMPQDIALVDQLTIKETIFYFGRIYDMDDGRTRERFNILKGLLELPAAENIIGNLSGGQQRRVSFACALVHEPELVILDEPTVGLDPILREKIWGFLVEKTRTSNLAVIITTHYIEEARKANKIGLMRNGILLAEDTPQNIMTMYNSSTLEDAFLILSESQSEEADNTLQRIGNTSESEQRTRRNLLSFNKQNQPRILEKLLFTSRSRMKALLTKNILQLTRQKIVFAIIFLFPLFQCTCFYFAIGNNVKNLKIGIVNDEVANYKDCYNKSLITTYVHDGTCDLNKVSCRYLNRMPPDMEKVYYETIDEAYTSSRQATVIGFIHFASNFSESLAKIRDDGRNVDDGSFIGSEIQISLDMSNHQLAYFVERTLREMYGDFARNLMVDCKLAEALGRIPIRFEAPIFGSFDAPYRNYIAPGFIMTMTFFLSTITTATVFITDRSDGTWGRTLVAGISMSELLLAHILTQMTIVILQCVEVILCAAFGFQAVNLGRNSTLIAMLILDGFAGMLFGLLISLICKTHTQANFLATGAFYPMVILCGLLWPLEGMPVFLKNISFILPFSIPATSIRNIIEKGWSITHPQVYNGFIIISLWIVGLFLLCLLSLRRQK